MFPEHPMWPCTHMPPSLWACCTLCIKWPFLPPSFPPPREKPTQLSKADIYIISSGKFSHPFDKQHWPVPLFDQRILFIPLAKHLSCRQAHCPCPHNPSTHSSCTGHSASSVRIPQCFAFSLCSQLALFHSCFSPLLLLPLLLLYLYWHLPLPILASESSQRTIIFYIAALFWVALHNTCLEDQIPTKGPHHLCTCAFSHRE